MRATPVNLDDGACRVAIGRLDALPVRPALARLVLAADAAALGMAADGDRPTPPTLSPLAEVDPGWALARARGPAAGAIDPPATLADLRWWSPVGLAPAAADALVRLWRHAVAVASAARRLAREAGEPDPDRVARAGLLAPLGLWALAAVDPDRLAAWFAADAAGRLAGERRWLGAPVSAVGRRLAERWGCDPLVIEAAWLGADAAGDLNDCAADPVRLGWIQAAVARTRRTPWALDSPSDRDFGPPDADARILTAEVQARTGAPFIDPDATPREEGLTRDNLRLRRALARAEAAGASAARLVAALAESTPVEDPHAWADRAARAWSREPGVAAARVAWRGPGGEPAPSAPSGMAGTGPATEAAPPPSRVVPLGDPARPAADLLLWDASAAAPFAPPLPLVAGWAGWARAVADRERVGRSLDQAVLGHRDRVARDDLGRRRSLFAGLAEFAAGAGHELNNPLAVIMGRAQLVLARGADPETTRSLRAIIAQAQRAHRILRDLMFVARPGEFRPRACQPDEIVRASLRDLQDEAEARGVRLVLDAREPAARVWADPEPLRQVADILARNALEATEAGASIRFTTGGDARQVRWTVHDAGRGIDAAAGAHLFDPFFCGRQAGRGLGLGLSRAARIIDLVGGDIRWHSTPGHGATFQVTWPVEDIPAPAAVGRAEPDEAADRA